MLLASGAALAGKDYIVERNLLPALVPLADRRWRSALPPAGRVALGLACAVAALCLLACLRRLRHPHAQSAAPDFRDLAEQLGPPQRPRAIVTWKLAADPIRFYLDGPSRRAYRGVLPVREIDVVSKPVVARKPPGLPPGFRPVERRRLERLTLIRYVSPRIQQVPFHVLRDARTGFGRNAVVADGPHGAPWSGR